MSHNSSPNAPLSGDRSVRMRAAENMGKKDLTESSGLLRDVEGSSQPLKYPKSVFLIIINEFCERFCYYGMKAVLTLYLRDILDYDENTSTVLYHAFSMLCYFTPVFGAILADTYLGKFKTIMYLSILYALGNILLSVSSIPDTLPQRACSILGLVIIAVGTGGIKPCVSAFGGEQFVRPQQDRLVDQFFSIFYFSINAGSLISSLITPIFRRNVQCFGQTSCFPLAFGVPAVLMIVAIVVFFSGKWLYRIQPTQGNVVVDVSKCMAYAVKRKLKSSDEKKSHWLDYASDKFDKKLIDDIKSVLRVLLLYIPVPVFWALFDQQGSRWVFQATHMDGNVGSFNIIPDQMGIINSLLILALVPLFESCIYPAFTKCGLLTPLQRMGCGGLLAALAFVISGILELQLEPTYARVPGEGLTQMRFINSLPCDVSFNYTQAGAPLSMNHLNASAWHLITDLKALEPLEIEAHLSPSKNCQNVTQTTWNGQVKGDNHQGYSAIFGLHNGQLQLTRMKEEDPIEKTKVGMPRLGFILGAPTDRLQNSSIVIKNANNHYVFLIPDSDDDFIQTLVKDVAIGTYKVYMPYYGGKPNEEDPAGEIRLEQGGTYTVLAQRHFDSSKEDVITLMQITASDSVHMLWLIPQYFIITVAEVMFSVTGLQFSFTQAPASMRSLMQAIWLLTVAFGNLIVIFVAETKALSKQSDEFFLFAGLMVLDMIIFIYLAAGYEYVQVVEEKDEKPIKSNDAPATFQSDNQGFVDTPM